MKDIIKLNKILNNFNYQISTDTGVIRNISPNDFVERWHLLTPEEFTNPDHPGGVCWDYVQFESLCFRNMGIPYKTFYVMVDDDKDMPSHTILSFEYNGKTYLFESAWKSFVGIYEYNNEKEMIEDIAYQLQKDLDTDKVVYMQYDTSELKYGIGCIEYMDYFINSNRLEKIIPKKNLLQ